MEPVIYQWAMLVLGFLVGGILGYHRGYERAQKDRSLMGSALRLAEEDRDGE